MRKRIVAGNWKMNTSVQEGKELARKVSSLLENNEDVTVIICPPFTHLASILNDDEVSDVLIGAQNCHTNESGAYTGEVSASMLKSLNVNYCLVGHSERRAYFFEDNNELQSKIKQLLEQKIQPIFCCGEMLEDRQTNETFDVIASQCEVLWTLTDDEMKEVVIAYEPVWAIGTGETATAAQAQEVHAFIRSQIAANFSEEIAANTTIVYGGSCKASNAKELFNEEDIDGGLIGGASLKAEEFIEIVNSIK